MLRRLGRLIVGVFFRGPTCSDCGQKADFVFWHHGYWRCNPCIVKRIMPPTTATKEA